VLERALGRFDPTEVLEVRVLGIAGGLESREPGVDASPARADEVDEEREIVDASVAFCQKISLQSLEPSDCLVE